MHGSSPEAVRVPKPQAKPASSAQEVKERAIAEYTAKARRAGKVPDAGSIERLVMRELQIVEAVKRQQARPSASPSPRPRKERPDPIRKAEEETGTRLMSGAKRVLPPNMGAVSPQQMATLLGAVEAQRWAAATKRFAELIQQGDALQTTDIYRRIENTDNPDLAKEAMRVWTNYHLARYQESRFNRFLGMSEKDAAKKFMRLVYDICDRSTGQFGPWWVK